MDWSYSSICYVGGSQARFCQEAELLQRSQNNRFWIIIDNPIMNSRRPWELFLISPLK